MAKLDHYSKENPFKVPEGYFESFQDNIMENLERKMPEKKSGWQINSLKPFLAIAASFLLIFSVWALFLNKLEKRKSTSENSAYPELSYFEMDNSSEMIDLVSENNYDMQFPEINLKDDLDFLLDHVEISTIIEEI